MGRVRQGFLILLTVSGPLLLHASGPLPIFFPDDPIQVMPAPVPVAKISTHKIGETADFFWNSLRWFPPSVPAGGVNTLGVPPDSAWYTSRHGAHSMTREELQRGATVEPPLPPFTIVGGKEEGVTPGFRIEDAKGRFFFVKVDPPGNPEMASASDVIVSRFLYAIGYNVPQNYIVRVKVPELRISDKAKVTFENGRRRMTRSDLEQMTKTVHHYPDGSIRLMASLKIEGEAAGPFFYEGTRKDDPNDLVPHENRRDLRALYVAFAWLNNTDARSGNTYDVVVHAGGLSFVKHYLLDFGSALGSDGDGPKPVRLGHEFMLASPQEASRSILTLGLLPRPWERIHYPDLPAVANFSAKAFDPDHWTSDYPNPAFQRREPDDDFWGAEQVMAFTSDDIRAIVETGQFSDPRVVEYLTSTLADRRDKIGRTFFARVLPLDNFRVESDELRFDDLAVRYEFRPPAQYDVSWFRFDNATGKRGMISPEASAHLPDDVKQATEGSYFSAVISSRDDKSKSLVVTLRKTDTGYRVVGRSRADTGPIR
jgi:hypothetical protein